MNKNSSDIILVPTDKIDIKDESTIQWLNNFNTISKNLKAFNSTHKTKETKLM